MKLLKRFSLFEILLVATILGIHLYAATADGYAFPNTWFIRDDAYYYFKVAQNITQGLGSTFDGINITNGYHPLWLLICIPIFYLARFDLILPLRVLLMVIAVFNAATAVLIYRIVSRSLSNAVAMLAAGYWAFNGYIHYAFYRPGLETPLAAFAVVLFIERLGNFESTWRTKPVTKTQIGGLAMIAVIAMFSRLDLIFLAIIAGIYIVFRGHPIRFLLPFDIAIIFLSMTSSIALRSGFPAYNFYAASAITATVIALVIKIITFYFAGLYQHPKMHTTRGLIRQTVIATAIGAVIFSGVMIVAMRIGIVESFPRAALLLDWLINLVLILALRFAVLRFGNKKINVNLSTPSPLAEFKSNWKTWFTEGWAYYRVLGGALALYMLYNKLAFRTSSPVSGQIKRWWGTLLHTVYDKPAANWTDFLGIGYVSAYDTWQPLSHSIRWLAVLIKPLYPGSNTEDERYYVVMAILALFVFAILFFNARRTLSAFSRMALLPLIASSGVHALSYTATAYGGAKEWYWISQVVLTILVFSILLDMILKPLQKYRPARLTLEAASLALGAYAAFMLNGFIVVNMPHGYFPVDKPYMEVVTYLEEHTPPRAVIGMTGGGNVGYFIKDRTIVNMDGLINSYDYFQVLKRNEAAMYLHERGMRIVFSNRNILMYSPYDGQFSRYLSSYSVYGGKSLMWLLPEPKKQPGKTP
jgi:hypothetical protein